MSRCNRCWTLQFNPRIRGKHVSQKSGSLYLWVGFLIYCLLKNIFRCKDISRPKQEEILKALQSLTSLENLDFSRKWYIIMKFAIHSSSKSSLGDEDLLHILLSLVSMPSMKNLRLDFYA